MPNITLEIETIDLASNQDKHHTVKSARHQLMRLKSSHVVQARLEDTFLRTGL